MWEPLETSALKQAASLLVMVVGGGRGGGLPRGDQLGGTWSVFIPLVVGGRKEPQR